MLKRIFTATLITFFIFFSLALATTPFTSKPNLGAQINWSHPLSKGLVACFLMNEGGGKLSTNLTNYSNGNLSNGAYYTVAKQNTVISFDGDNDIVINNKNTFYKQSPYSFFVIHYPLSSGGNTAGRILDNGAYHFYFSFSDTLLIFQVTTSGSPNSVYSDANCITLNKWNYHTVTWDGGILKTGIKIYSKAILQSVSNSQDGNGTISYALSNFNIGNVAAINRGYNGYISLLLGYNRVLSPSEIRSLYEEPYQFIEYEPWTMWGAIVATVRRRIRMID